MINDPIIFLSQITPHILNVYIKDISPYIDNKNNRPYWLMPVLLFPDRLESVFLTADKLKIKTFQIFK